MKSYKYLFLVMLLFCGITVYGQGGYDPNNPPEPNVQYNLNLQMFPPGAGSVYGAGKYTAGASVYVSASTNSGFRFKSWNEGETVLSTTSAFYYTMPARNASLMAIYEYDPKGPGDPETPDIPKKSKLYLEAIPAGSGYFNITSGAIQNEGASVYLYASPYSGFRFIEWRNGETVVSTSRNFYYQMGDTDTKLSAIFEYYPTNPDEPNVPQDAEHGLIALNQYGEAGQTLAFPVYLLNHNINIHSAEFVIQFPEGATVNSTAATLTDRKNGHTLSCQAQGDNAYRCTISGGAENYFFGSNGILLNIPVTLPAQWTAGETYPVKITDVKLGTANETINSYGKTGGLGINKTSENTVQANFYANKFLNRVYFINLSTENATAYKWDFGDGSSSTEKNPLHVYANEGNYDVKLIASNAQMSDTQTSVVVINPENTWTVSGIFSLNKQKKEVKNFTSAEELFLLLSRSSITGNIIIDTEAGETFDYPLSTEAARLSTVKDKLTASGHKLVLRKDGAGGEPVINLAGNADPDLFKMIVALSRQIEQQNVQLKIFGQTVHTGKIFGYTTQPVCSGTNSVPVDFSEISSAFTYNWTLTTSPAATTTGYLVSGNNTIPAMPLVNTSTRVDTLKYKVSINYPVNPPQPAVELYTFDYSIVVYPVIQEAPVITSPKADTIINTTTVTLSWSSVLNADSYEITVWEKYDDEPEKPNVINIKTNSYQTTTLFQYGKSYNWKVTARNECKQLESEPATFSVRKLPNLHVTAIETLTPLYSGVEAKIAFEVKNDGSGATLETEHWFDQVGLIRNLQNPTSEAYWFLKKQNRSALNAGASYWDTVTVKLPERLSGNYYLVVSSDMGTILSIDWAPADNTIPEPYTPSVSGIPYPYLKVQTESSANLIPEEKETNTLTDNFFYLSAKVNIPKLPDLQVVSIEIPDSIVETRSFSAKAIVKNVGDSILAGRNWTDGIWRNKDSGFTSNAVLIATQSVNVDLEPGDSYTLTFDLTAPIDSLTDYYYFVVADLNDVVYESDETNNRLRSSAVKVHPYLIEEEQYDRLLNFYNVFGGTNWKNKWRPSRRFGNNWQGVTIDKNGQVSGISLPSNNLAGELSETFWIFPQLTTLNLSGNQLQGNLDALFSSSNIPEGLVSLDLSKNKINGNIPASVSNAKNLERLNVSYNRLTGIEQALPQSIKNLEIDHQLLPSDSIGFSSRPVLPAASIASYDHANQNFDFVPSYGLYTLDSMRLLTYSPSVGTQYNWTLPGNARNFVWRQESGQEFILIQDNGMGYGNSKILKLGFPVGDASIDQQVNVLDVQHSLNYIFNEHVSAFNFTAADTYKDNVITVQDLIKTIDIIFDTSSTHPSPPAERSSQQAENYLYIDEGKLVLSTLQNVAAMDVTLQGVSEEDLRFLLDDTQFQLVSRNRDDGVRFILFSPQRGAILPGTTPILEVRKNSANLIDAVLSDIEAQLVPVELSPGTVTGILPVEDEVSLFANAGVLYYSLPGKADHLTVAIYTPMGTLIDRYETDNVSPGKYNLNLNRHAQGIYIVKMTTKSGSQIVSKNSKIIITK